jgi:dyslexia susceptibility 1 candidate gene 1 protein
MPIQPTFEWEQTATHVLITAHIMGFKAEAIDVFISDLFVKVNAAPTYVLSLDLFDAIVVDKSSFSTLELPALRLKLQKATAEPWPTLCIDKATPNAVVRQRRDDALARAEALYNVKLDTREKQKEVEKKRMFNEHWELEKQQRSAIEEKVRNEKEAERSSLHQWETSLPGPSSSSTNRIMSPSDIPAIRRAETTNVSIDFTPKSVSLPTRSRGDEDYYRKSRYKPVSIEDSPMFWKDKGDKLYRSRNWKAAADAYTESIKRDGCFMSCVSNRAACFLQMHNYARAIEDCDLALTMLANTPASETTQERYRFLLTKLHTRRGAAYCWSGDYSRGVDDYRLAVAYRSSEQDHDVAIDLAKIEDTMKANGLCQETDPVTRGLQEASRFYYDGNYAAAAEAYRALLVLDEFNVRARNNLTATLLQQGAFKEAFEEAKKVIEFCAEVAQALSQPGAASTNLADSDDEEECEDELVARRNAAAKKIGEKSGHVYLLLKAYVRGAAALCGLKDYPAAHGMMEAALRITPYDDDLRDDLNKIAEKIRFNTLVSASTKS